jgi:hypothetical protein
VKAVARKYFREKHGSRPSKVVAEHDSKRVPIEDSVWTVMVADHSSGSLSGNEQYDITTNND